MQSLMVIYNYTILGTLSSGRKDEIKIHPRTIAAYTMGKLALAIVVGYHNNN